MKWRMEKHTRDHSVDIKFCHYFNNDKPCPYDKIGCKFKHEISPECRYNLKCTFKLCQFTHTTKKGEELVHRQELETHNEGVVEDNEESYGENDYEATNNEGVVEDFEERYGEHDYDSDTDSMKRMITSHADPEADTSYNRLLKKNMESEDSEDSDSSDEEEIDPNRYGIRGLLQKMSTAYARGKGDDFRC